jgi:hypothetical protein
MQLLSIARPPDELCIVWQPSQVATPPSWKAYALPAEKTVESATAMRAARAQK